jgi:hypothetical protein
MQKGRAFARPLLHPSIRPQPDRRNLYFAFFFTPAFFFGAAFLWLFAAA